MSKQRNLRRVSYLAVQLQSAVNESRASMRRAIINSDNLSPVEGKIIGLAKALPCIDDGDRQLLDWLSKKQERSIPYWPTEECRKRRAS